MLKPMVFFILADIGLIGLLARFGVQAQFRKVGWVVVAASSLFWGLFGTALVAIYWRDCYSYFAPGWVWMLTPTLFATYGLVGAGLHWLSLRLPGKPLFNFVILGGLESIPEHLLGIYGFKILEVVPMLEGFRPLEILIFAFFEYLLYWGGVVGLALILTHLWERWALAHPKQPSPQG